MLKFLYKHILNSDMISILFNVIKQHICDMWHISQFFKDRGG